MKIYKKIKVSPDTIFRFFIISSSFLFFILDVPICQAQSQPLSQTQTPSQGQQPKSSFNTQVFEKQSSEESFTDTVKMIRSEQDQWEVLFNSKKRVYTLKRTEDQEPLKQAYEDKLNVNVTVNSDTDQILKVKIKSGKNAKDENKIINDNTKN